MPQRQAMRPQARLDSGAADAGLDSRGAARAVDLEGAVKAPQVEADRSLVAVPDGGLDAAHHRRAAAERDHGDAGPARPIQDSGDVRLARGDRYEIGGVREVAVESADGFWIGLAVSV